MEKKMENIIFYSWYMDTLEYVNDREKQRVMKEKENRKKSKNIYKIRLYNFTSDTRPYYLVDGTFNDVFKFDKYIYAVEKDYNHVEEIRTGKVFPIVDIEKESSDWKSSYIKYSDDNSKYQNFSIRKNFVLKADPINLKELENYLKCDEEVFDSYLDGSLAHKIQKMKKI